MPFEMFFNIFLETTRSRKVSCGSMASWTFRLRCLWLRYVELLSSIYDLRMNMTPMKDASNIILLIYFSNLPINPIYLDGQNVMENQKCTNTK